LTKEGLQADTGGKVRFTDRNSWQSQTQLIITKEGPRAEAAESGHAEKA